MLDRTRNVLAATLLVGPAACAATPEGGGGGGVDVEATVSVAVKSHPLILVPAPNGGAEIAVFAHETDAEPVDVATVLPGAGRADVTVPTPFAGYLRVRQAPFLDSYFYPAATERFNEPILVELVREDVLAQLYRDCLPVATPAPTGTVFAALRNPDGFVSGVALASSPATAVQICYFSEDDETPAPFQTTSLNGMALALGVTGATQLGGMRGFGIDATHFSTRRVVARPGAYTIAIGTPD